MPTLHTPRSAALDPQALTGVVLAGGQGARMGGVDKGLQALHGRPLAAWALERLRPQVGSLMLSANRHLAQYRALGVAVWPDADGLEPYAGPLAGLLTALHHCASPYLATVPCDAPYLPHDLVARLGQALLERAAALAMACAPDGAGVLQPQSVFCLMRTDLAPSLAAFVHGGGRGVQAWARQQRLVLVPFDQVGDDARAFAPVNTLDALARLATTPPPRSPTPRP